MLSLYYYIFLKMFLKKVKLYKNYQIGISIYSYLKTGKVEILELYQLTHLGFLDRAALIKAI